MANAITINKIFQAPEVNIDALKTKTFVGIDFGTSTTVVSLASYNGAQITCQSLELPQFFKDGAKTESELMPSCIAYTLDGKALVGQGAYELKGKPDYIFGENIWYSFKMELGKDLGPRWFRSSHEKIKSPQDATAVFFKYLKATIERYCKQNDLSSDIYYAVSIPASFESNQRKDLLAALEANEMTLLSQNLIDEPNAAFLGYITPDVYYKEPIELRDAISPKVLVFDFGAGTCDISILELSADYSGLHTRNISISQFTELGGNDIDRYIAYNILLPKLFEGNEISNEEYSENQKEVIVQQLLGIAERLKIQMCKDFNYLLTDPKVLKDVQERNLEVSVKIPTIIYTDYKDLVQDTFRLSYNDFIKTMNVFFKKSVWSDGSTTIKGQKKYNSIYKTLDSAIKKASITKSEIDYVMMIGGSSKNPFVQTAVKEYFSEHTKMLIPQNLQSLVSQGAAIHSLLNNGLGITVLRPITSEPIVVMTKGEQTAMLIPAGTEIPFPAIKITDFSTGDSEKERLEIPICVSNKNKILTNLVITNPDGETFPANATVELTLEMTADKLLKVDAVCNGIVCATHAENPFANTYLTDKERKVLEAERNTYISANNNGGKPSRESLITLREAYVAADKDLQAAETYEEQVRYYPQDDLYNNIGVLYHNAGNYTKAIRFYKKAIEQNPNHQWAYSNMGHDLYLNGKYDEAEIALKRALEISPNRTTAMIVLGRLNKEKGDNETAKKYFEQAYNILMRMWHEHKTDDCDCGWLESVARELGHNEEARQVADSQKSEDDDKVYNADNLISAKRKEQ